MKLRSFFHATLAALLASALAACASMPAPTLHRAGPGQAAAQDQAQQGPVSTQPLAADDGLPRAQIRRGSGRVIDSAVAASAPPSLGGTSGEATFNFEGEPVQVVVKAILGDMLGQNYVIAPEVQGTVTLATPRKVSPV